MAKMEAKAALTWLPDGALASEVWNCGCEPAGRMYTGVAEDAEMGILGEKRLCHDNLSCR